jgi:dolichol-phosphate mannosyltransferase
MADKDSMTDGHSRETVAFVIPLYNEEDVVPLLLEEIETYRRSHPEVVEIVLIDDGSRDRTAERVRDLTSGREGYTLIRFSRNFGHQIAITAGMEFVKSDAAVIMDADLQDPLSVVTTMIDKWRDGFDVVYGIREEREGEAWLRRSATYLFYRFFRRMSDVEAPLDTGDFRLVSREVLDAFKMLQERQPFVRGLVAWLGFHQTGIRYARPARAAGKTKYPYRKLWRLATDGITAFSDKPLWYAAAIGMTISFCSVGGLVWVILDKYVFGVGVTGWASLIFAAFFFGGVQLFFLGIVGAYLARVYEEVKRRPRYVLQDVWESRERSVVNLGKLDGG